MNLDKVVACLKAINLKPKIDEFEDRLLIQKAVYLLQLKGIKTNFSYHLYVRGPYSKELTDEIYDNRNKVERLETSLKLSNTEAKMIGEFNELFFGLKPGILEVAATYSLFAFDQKQDAITALKNVKRMKSFYSEAQIAVGISKAKEFLFRPSEKEISELKEELRPWQEASAESMRG